jgi:signal transduction histidine kinase
MPPRLAIVQAPLFASEQETQLAKMFYLVAWSTIAVATLFLAAIMMFDAEHRPRAAIALLIVYALGIGLLYVNHRGSPRIASAVFVGGLIALVTGLSFQAGGIHSPGVSLYLVFVLMAGVLLGQRAGIVFAAICTLLGLALVIIERAGLLPPPSVTYDARATWLLVGLYMGVVLLLTRLASQTVQGALARAESELADRRETEVRLQRALDATSERMKELTLLHWTTQLLRDRDVHVSVFQELVTRMPAAWTHPEICQARIAYRALEATTLGWRDSERKMSARIMTSGGDGIIEVAYIDPKNPDAAAPFQPEEFSLVNSLAEILTNWLEQSEAERRRHATEYQLRQSQKMEALGKLAGGIANDFNNILTSVTGNADLALAELPADHPARASIDGVVQAGGRATELVKRILLFSRKQETDRKPVSLQPVVEEVARLLRSSLRPTVDVRVTTSGRIPLVNADASQFYHVVLNLGTNAGHAMKGKGGVVEIGLDTVELKATDLAALPDLSPGTHLRLSVRDTGVGMSAETLERIYEPFFTTKGFDGTGLGLSVVHGIVKDHGGAITVESAPAKGTTFVVHVPAAQQGVRAGTGAITAAIPAANANMTGNGEHVLCLDDDEAVAGVIPRLLKRLGYRCTPFTDPHAALAALRGSPSTFDAVITDFAMPAMNGAQFIREARSIRADIPVILTTGFGDDVASLGDQEAMRVAKPLTSAILGRALATLLRKGLVRG